MSVPDDTVTPTPDEVPDPVRTTAPEADPAPGEGDQDASDAKTAVLPVYPTGRSTAGGI